MYIRKNDDQMKNVGNKKINNAKDEHNHQMASYPKATKKEKGPHDKYPDWNDNKKPKDGGGGSMSPKKPAPKKPMSPAAKKLKRTASRSK